MDVYDEGKSSIRNYFVAVVMIVRRIAKRFLVGFSACDFHSTTFEFHGELFLRERIR